MNTAKTSKRSFAFLLTALITAFVAVVLRTVGFIFFFDGDIGYFTSGAVIPIIFNLLLFAATVFFAILSILKLKGEKVVYCAPNGADKAAFIIAAVASVALSVSDLISAIKGEATGLLLMILSLLSGLYFIYDLLKFKKITKMELSILIFVRVTLLLAVSYFDQTVQMNSPDKVLFGLACLCVMFFTVNEMKILVGSMRPATFYLSSALTIVFCISASVPSIIACCIGKLPFDGLFFEYVMLLAIAVYCVTRLLNVRRAVAASDMCANEENCLDGDSVESTDASSDAAETTPEKKEET